ncbi:MAG: hypothetical protein KGI72_05365 [Patescibacteria group bacterium]|nr:hypothetical protein [Patescibacteria group bacterium]MDE2233089.1 hypothetical protein [Patescibacteria group bacterium]
MSRIVQRGATGPLSLTASGTFQQSTDGNLLTLCGTRWDLEDGREVVLVQANSSADLAEGKLMQDAALVANHSDLAVTATQAYSNNGNVPATVTVTLGGTAVTAGQYAGGYAVVVDGAGAGQTLQIANHPAQATTNGNVVITLADAPNTALDTTSKVSLVPQPGTGVIINPTTATNTPRGVTLYPITKSSFGFLISKGTVSCLADSTAPGVGTPISPSVNTAGAIMQTAYATNVVTEAVIGRAIYATVSAKYYPVVVDL